MDHDPGHYEAIQDIVLKVALVFKSFFISFFFFFYWLNKVVKNIL